MEVSDATTPFASDGSSGDDDDDEEEPIVVNNRKTNGREDYLRNK